MKITEISFSKKMSYAPYHPLQPGMVATLDEGEDPLEAMKKLDDLCTQYYENQYLKPQNNNSLYSSEAVNQSEISDNPLYLLKIEESLTPSQKIIAQINECKELTVLKSFELLAKNNPEIKEAYSKRLNELSES